MINNLFNQHTNKRKLGLFGIISGLALIHINLTNKLANSSDQQFFVLIFWGGLIFFLWQRRNTLKLNSDIFSTIIGCLLIAIILWKSITIFWYEAYFLSLFPLMAGLGVALIASGFNNLKQYWREIIIIIFICLPGSYWENELIEKYFYVSQSTAQFAHFWLWILNFNVARKGVIILYNTGGVLVNYSCTGTVIIVLLLKLTLLLILTFPTSGKQKFWLVFDAISLGFILGGIRVIILTLIVNNKPIFTYWHGSEGASIFSTMSMIIFALIASSIIQSKPQEKNKKNNKFNKYFRKLSD